MIQITQAEFDEYKMLKEMKRNIIDKINDHKEFCDESFGEGFYCMRVLEGLLK